MVMNIVYQSISIATMVLSLIFGIIMASKISQFYQSIRIVNFLILAFIIEIMMVEIGIVNSKWNNFNKLFVKCDSQLIMQNVQEQPLNPVIFIEQLLVSISILTKHNNTPIKNVQITLACCNSISTPSTSTHSIQQMTDEQGIINSQFDKASELSTYVCSVIGIHPEYGYDTKVFRINEDSSQILITLQLQKPIEQPSNIISQVVYNHQGLFNATIAYEIEQINGIVHSESNGNFTISIKLQKPGNLNLKVMLTGYDEQVVHIATPQPPFNLYLPIIELQKQLTQYSVQFDIKLLITTQFKDPIEGASCTIQCMTLENAVDYQKLGMSDSNGIVRMQFSFHTFGGKCKISITKDSFAPIEQFLQITLDTLTSGSPISFHQEVRDNNLLLTNLNPSIVLDCKSLTISMVGKFQKPFTGLLEIWLSRIYYPIANDYRLANSEQNSTLKNSIQLKENSYLQLDYKFKLQSFYQYQFTLNLQSDTNEQLTIKSNSTSDIIDFGVIKFQPQQQRFSKYYTLIVGQILEMQNPKCIRSISKHLTNISVQFYYVFQTKQLINQTMTNHMGMFNLQVSHPLINGLYSALIVISDAHYLTNQISINIETTDNNQTLQLGTFELVPLNGSSECQ